MSFPLDGLEDGSLIAIQTSQLDVLDAAGAIPSRTPSSSAAFSNVDPFDHINDRTPEEIERLAKLLEIRGAQPGQIRMRHTCFVGAGISAGMKVLEIGCGTGVVARELAGLTGKAGRVVGLDVSAGMLDYARQRSVACDEPITYRCGDAYHLDFPDGWFDASCSITLFAHLDDHDRVVREMRRVTRHTIMVLDQDYQTLVFDHSDTALTRRILQHGADCNVLDGWCGRKLSGLLVRHGTQNVQCWPFVYTERDSQSYLITIAERFAALAARRGVVTEHEAKAWLQELYDRSAAGMFFASLNYYFAFGRV